MAHGPASLLQFGPFALDRGDGRLLRGGRPVELKPKALALLLALIDHAGRVVAKDELLDAVWGTRYITEGVIKTQVAELRAALGDDPKAPRWIETVHGRGYRFAGQVNADPAPADDPVDNSPLVGRGEELAVLRQAFERARAGERQLVAVAGDPGVGKSTLLATFIATLDGARVASGQCVERWGGNEPYLPVLNALDQLCAAEPGLVPAVRDVAPMWLVQMPWHLPDADRVALQSQLTGASPERMLREFGALAERLAAERPLVWLVEDVHWADPATVHLIAALARRRGPAALMLVLTFRPIDLAFTDHPFGDLRRELRLQRQMHELPLEGLSRDAIGLLVRRRHGERCAPDAFVDQLHRYTEGLPLFALGVLDELVDAGVIAPLADGSGNGLAADATSRLAVPRTLADMFDGQLQRLPADVNELLEVAALAGHPFDHLTLADALGQPPDAVRAHLDDLVRRRIWLLAAGVAQMPDGRIATRCAFRHAVIRHVLAARAGTLTRIERHRALAAAVERQWGATAELAPQLALHHEEGQQPVAAARQLAVAGTTALQRQAPREALALAERGLALLAPLGAAADAERLPLISVRLTATVLSEGMASAAARAQVGDLLARLDTLPAGAATMPLWQVAMLTHLTGRLPGTSARVQRFGAIVRDLPGDAGEVGRAVAGNAAGVDALHLGRLTDSLHAFEATLDLPDRAAHAILLLRSPRDEAWAYLCLVAETLARPALAAAAHAHVDSLVARGSDLITVVMGRWFQVYAHYFRGDAVRAQALAGECVALLESLRASPFLQPHRIALGWANAALGRVDEGLAMAEDGLRRYVDQGSQQGLAGLHAVVAETCRLAGRTDTMARHVREGLAVAERNRDGFALSELHRLQGAAEAAPADQEAALRRALAHARDQDAGLLEARAAVALRDWLVAAARPEDAAEVVAATRARLPEGVDAPVVRALGT
ncbi:ATP-binding protein [Piscinibacter gummiphilus]|uniref:Uncharacterized protein n=1 Tax=Piscinibacter gummiphilus TaxID=946333 RepID=A0A1W6L4A4_9BURK|nr:AAA family ATPase [Piscinibacter gummiphilus]ARN19017.1 hypothetical protein A4W93_03275 [Piscinibacter gummiphilus]ATU63662.1 hypothetical protein CPZ87_03350 [Piscinibacter gummiphilus]GLS93410.1 hypothetical protein GCM10007918_07010 [Piscinibacter gummiphilus]